MTRSPLAWMGKRGALSGVLHRLHVVDAHIGDGARGTEHGRRRPVAECSGE